MHPGPLMRDPADVTAPQGRANLFDFLRCALAVLVIYSHSHALLAGNDETEPLYRWTRGQLTGGGLAVDSFFIISGYLITQSWVRSRGLGDFLLKRVLRVYPAFIVAVALGVLVVAPLSSGLSLSIDAGDWLLGTLDLRGYTPANTFPDNPLPNAVNGSLWSVAYEFWCYLGIALLGTCALLRHRRLISAFLLLAIAVSIVFVAWDLNPGGKVLGVIFGAPSCWARLLPYYLAGTTFYLWRDRTPMSWTLAGISVAVLFAGPLLAPWGVALTCPLALTYLLLFLALRPIPGLVGWAKRGDFSYGLYLYAFPVQQLLVMWRPAMQPLELFSLALPLTLLCAFVSWHLIEKPFLELKTNPTLKRWTALTPAGAKLATLEQR